MRRGSRGGRGRRGRQGERAGDRPGERREESAPRADESRPPRAPRSDPREEHDAPIDPEVVEPLARLGPKIPWAPIALVAIVLLWIPLALHPERDPVRPIEASWIPRFDAASTLASVDVPPASFSAAVTRRALELEASARGIPSDQLAGAEEFIHVAGARRPSTIAALLFLLIFYVLGRRMIGEAAALVAAALLAVSGPFQDAARSAHPLLIAETLALAGVAWMVGIEARHREVGFTRWSAIEACGAGLLFGAALVEHPATFPTVIAALVLWLSLGLRRGHATTLPASRPSSSGVFAVLGCLGLAATTALTIAGLEHVAGSPTRGFFASLASPTADPRVWVEFYRWMVSPVLGTDVLVVAAVLLVAAIAILERSLGTHWRGAGLLPWIYLLLFVGIVAGIGFAPSPRPPSAFRSLESTSVPLLELPLPLPALFVLGLGWLVLRGLSPGRVRRQEYTFLLVWLALGILLLPTAVAMDGALTGASPRESLSRVAMTVLPMVVLAGARAARAFWDTERAPLARVGILAFILMPVLAALVGSFGRFATATGVAVAPDPLDRFVPTALGVAAALGAISVLLTVRPDQPILVRRTSGQRGSRGSRRRHSRGGRPSGTRRGRPPR